MTNKPNDQNDPMIELVQSSFKSQYHASLAMLKQMIEDCPEKIWVSEEYTNPYWRIAYHTLYFLHLYTRPTMSDFRPWEKHQTGIHDMDDIPAPPEIEKLTEFPHRPPQTGVPYTKAEMLEYWEFCELNVDGWVEALDLTAPESGFSWYKIPKFEFQLVTLRHLAHHVAQLGERLRTSSDIPLKWAGHRRPA